MITIGKDLELGNIQPAKLDSLYNSIHEIRDHIVEYQDREYSLTPIEEIQDIVKNLNIIHEIDNEDNEIILDVVPKNQIPTNDDCVICLNNLISSVCVSLPCGHYYHNNCITEWLRLLRHITQSSLVGI
jgi:hypothetical protein